jgi:hypothetical protein
MVKGLLLLLALLPLAAMAAEPGVWIELESRQVELGQPLSGALHTRGIPQAPTPEDLKPLEQGFSLQDIGTVETSEVEGATRSRLPFTLYPRQSGTLTLPALAIAGRHSETLSVEVAPAQAQGVPLAVTAMVATTNPWVREQVLITMEVITPDRFASLAIEPPQLPGFEVIALAGERTRLETAEGERTRLRSGLALFALTPGTRRLRLPPVHYRLDGGTRRLFPLPEPELEVKPLPPYVPPTLPVGRVRIDSALEGGGVGLPHELGFWQLRLEADAVPPGWLPPLQRSLVNNEQIRFLPPQSEYSAAANVGGVNARVVHRVPFSALGDGRLALPTLTVDYFDPATGRLERAVHQPPRPLVLGIPARVAIGVLALALALWALPGLWRRAVARWRCRRERGAALEALGLAEDDAALRAALRRYAAAAGGSPNISLSALQWRLGREIQPELISMLAIASYAPAQAIDLPGLRRRLQEQLKRRRCARSSRG